MPKIAPAEGELNSPLADSPVPVMAPPTGGLPHVLFLIDQLCEMGGAERVLLNTIRLLPKDRFRASLITFKVDPSLSIFSDFPCPYHIFPIQRTYGLSGIKAAWKLRRFIRHEKVSIVHTFFETSDLWGGFIAKTAGNVSLVSSRRDMGIQRSGKHDFAYRFISPHIDLISTVSEEVRRFCIQKDKLPPAKVQTLYNGIELEKIECAKPIENIHSSLGLQAGAPLIITVGHIRRVKGFDVLIKAAAEVVREFPNAGILIVGRTSEQKHLQELQALIASLGLQSNVRFTGETEDIYSLLKVCDIFVLPSRSEGFSNALIEAMACQVPSIASRVGGNPEAVVDGTTGYLFESEDTATLAKRILALLRNRARAREIGIAGREIVKRKFTTQVMMQQLVGSYERLLQERQD
jgi:glycosyltransferase involved in cell wall biosynthesis